MQGLRAGHDLRVAWVVWSEAVDGWVGGHMCQFIAHLPNAVHVKWTAGACPLAAKVTYTANNTHS